MWVNLSELQLARVIQHGLHNFPMKMFQWLTHKPLPAAADLLPSPELGLKLFLCCPAVMPGQAELKNEGLSGSLTPPGLLLLFFFAKKNKNKFSPTNSLKRLRGEKLQKYFKCLLFFLRGQKCNVVLFWPRKYLCEQGRSKIRENHWVWLWHRLWCQRCGFTLGSARACLCNLEPATFTSVLQLIWTLFLEISCTVLGQILGEKGAFQLTMKIWVLRWCGNRGKLWQFELRRAPPKFVPCPAHCAWFAGVCPELLQCKQWSAFSK